MLDYELDNPLAEDKPADECGVFGIYNKDDFDISAMTYFALHALQHRGQESCGIASCDHGKIDYYKNIGLVAEVFSPGILKKISGKQVSIGHVRYSTSGKNSVINAQPFVVRYRMGELAIAHNGNLVNSLPLEQALAECGALYHTQSDTELILHAISHYAHDCLEDAIIKTMQVIKGSYSLVITNGHSLIGVRDPQGIRPLIIGKKNDSYMLASESCALDALDAQIVRDVEPGEIVIIDENGLRSIDTLKAKTRGKLCVFEFVYFARNDSIIDNIEVFTARKKFGRALARTLPVDADIVAGVPDSALPAAQGYSEESGIPFADALVKNRYVGRTFIQPEQSMRELAVHMKLNPLRPNINGKRIVLVDDSIVRGTTSKRIVDMLRHAGAKEVHMRISSPPVRHPCHFGIDTPSPEHLISAQYSIEEVRRIIGADTLAYLSIGDMIGEIHNSKCDFCEGCFTGKYPVAESAFSDKVIL